MIKVLGLGDNVVDKYMHIRTMYPGGNALNIAATAQIMGMQAAYLGMFGDDDAGMHVYDTIRKMGIDTLHCRFQKGENGYAEVKLVDGDRTFIGSNLGGVSKEYPLDLTEIDYAYIAQYDLCHTSIFSYTEPYLERLSQMTTFLSMDFSNRYDDEYLKANCPYIDCAAISCGNASKEKVEEEIKKIVSYGCRHIVIATRGSKGAVVYVDGKIYEQSPCLIKAVDTMAAGDSFIASFLIHYLDGMKDVREFPADSGKNGITTISEYKDLCVRSSLYQAAIFASQQCQRDGSFGYGKKF